MALTPEQTYEWWVAAVSANGTHFCSAGQTFTLANPAPSPIGPKGTIPVSANYDEPTFTWTSVAYAASYDVWVNDVTTGQSMVLRNSKISASNTSWQATMNLTPGDTYQWWVATVSANGAEYWSTGQTFFMLASLPAPIQTGPSGVIAVSANYNEPTFTWNSVPAAASYDVWVNDVTTGQAQVVRQTNLSASSTSFQTTTALTPGQTYEWWVATVSANGTHFWSAGQTFTLAPLPAPTQTGPSGIIAVSASYEEPTFTWNSVAYAASYDVWVNDVTTGQAQVVRQTNLSPSSTSFQTTTALTPGQTYEWWVATVSANGTHFWNAGQTFTLAPLPAPTQTGPSGTIAVSANYDEPTFTWNSVAYAASYDVWVNDVTTGQAQVVRQANLSASSTSFQTTTALTPGQTYEWWVASVSANGTHFWSAGQMFTLANPAPTQTGPSGAIAVGANYDEPTFTWNSVAYAASYDVWVNDVTTGQAQVVRQTNLSASSTSFQTTTALTPGQTYEWWVATVSANGTHFCDRRPDVHACTAAGANANRAERHHRRQRQLRRADVHLEQRCLRRQLRCVGQ